MASFFSNSDNERDNASAILHLREPIMANSYSEGVLPENMMMYMNNYSSALPVNNLMLMHQLENAAASAAAAGGGGVFQATQNMQGQGLSLTLGTQVPSGFHISSSFQNQSSEPGFSSIMCANNQSLDGNTNGGHLGSVHSSTSNQESRNFDYMSHGGHVPANNFDQSPYGMFSSTRSVPNPKYLKAAQELLDEVVNVKTALKEQTLKSRLIKDTKENDGKAHIGGSDSNEELRESSSNSPAELSASEKQELQNKLNKLLEMLDEVDRKYKQYYHQMQFVVSSFDIVAGGSGASKPYTALALRTISRHFRCLRDAISEQIQTARKGLGDQDAFTNSKGIGISRLRYIDQHIRQGRAFQQLGMIQQHAWRPQRGLPESSVSILRAWLFEHFLHPYPKDSDKIMLARQTGLSRSQVSNWFINARVRLWKPMVEEMYKEESGDVEMDAANSPSELAAIATSSDVKASEDNKGDDLQQSIAFDPQQSTHWTEEESRIENTFDNSSNMLLQQDSRFVQSNESGGVTLTLGLQYPNVNVPMSIDTHQDYATMRGGSMYNTTMVDPSVEAGEYDCLDSGNRQHHRFGFLSTIT